MAPIAAGATNVAVVCYAFVVRVVCEWLRPLWPPYDSGVALISFAGSFVRWKEIGTVLANMPSCTVGPVALRFTGLTRSRSAYGG